MIVVADTTPLNYLIQMDRAAVLQHLYGKVLAPFAVRQEMLHLRAPAKVRGFASNAPDWLEWAEVRTIYPDLPPGLDVGEQEAISLAIERSADLILVDDLEARQAALSQKLKVTGTLALVSQIAWRENADLACMLAALQGLGFRVSSAMLKTIRDEHEERRRRG